LHQLIIHAGELEMRRRPRAREKWDDLMGDLQFARCDLRCDGGAENNFTMRQSQ
jgi:hypothetical protein